MEVLARGEDGCRPPALALLREIFAVPGARLGPPSLLGGDLLQPLARLLDGAHAPLALQVRQPRTGMLGMRSVNHVLGNVAHIRAVTPVVMQAAL